MSDLSSSHKGKLGEQMALQYLQRKGYTILAVNYKALGAEIDIVAQIKHELVVVEVKSRQQESESVAEAISARKKSKLERAIHHFQYCHPYTSQLPVRLEVVVIFFSTNTIQHYREEFFDF